MKILIVSHRYYPSQTARAYRWDSISKYFGNQGHDVDIITCTDGNTYDKDKEFGQRLKIIRVQDLSLKLKRIFIQGRTTKEYLKREGGKSPKRFIARLFLFIYKGIYKNLIWPDIEIMWVISVIIKIRKLLKQNKYDAIITVARPFSSHIVGHLIKKIFPHVVWIIDIGDPFSFDYTQNVNNTYLYNKLNIRYERYIFNLSNAVTVTNMDTKIKYINTLKLDTEIINVIGPMLSIDYNQLSENAGNNNKDIINVLFYGTLYNDIRNPEYAIILFSKLRECCPNIDLRFNIYGNIYGCEYLFEKYSYDWINYYGYYNREKLVSIIQDSDILLNIGNITEYQLPSKIIEYAATGLPIINVKYISGDSSERFLANYSSVINLDNRHAIDKNIILKVAHFINNAPNVEKKDIAQIIQPYTLESISNQYLKLLNKV